MRRWPEGRGSTKNSKKDARKTMSEVDDGGEECVCVCVREAVTGAFGSRRSD